MARAYLRLDPAFFDRKVIDQKYPPGAVAALIGALCHAEHQPKRGRFRDVRVLKALLGPLAKWIPFLIEHRDLVTRKGELYVDGWDEWQEGDWKVGERVKRIRNRQKAEAESADVTPPVTPDVTPDVTVESESDDSVGTVYNPSDGDRQSVIDGGGAGGGGKRNGSPSQTSTREADDQEPTFTKTQLRAWASFGSEWDDVRAAWVGRGFRHPPSGEPDDPTGQRGLLYQILDARPTTLPQWIREAKGKTAHEVIAHVLERWHAVQAEAGDDEAYAAWTTPRDEAARVYAEIEARSKT